MSNSKTESVQKINDSALALMQHIDGDYSGARVCRAVLLAGWDPVNFPLDISELGLLGGELGQAAWNIVYLRGRGIADLESLPKPAKERIQKLSAAAYAYKNNV